MNCLRAADCVLFERNLSTTDAGCVQQKHLLPLTDLGQIEPQMAFCGHRSHHRAPHGACGVLGGSQSQVSGSAQFLHGFRSQAGPFIHLLQDLCLVGLKDGHCVDNLWIYLFPIRAEVVLHGLEGRRGRDFQEGTKEGERWEAKVSSTTGMAV